MWASHSTQSSFVVNHKDFILVALYETKAAVYRHIKLASTGENTTCYQMSEWWRRGGNSMRHQWEKPGRIVTWFQRVSDHRRHRRFTYLIWSIDWFLKGRIPASFRLSTKCYGRVIGTTFILHNAMYRSIWARFYKISFCPLHLANIAQMDVQLVAENVSPHQTQTVNTGFPAARLCFNILTWMSLESSSDRHIRPQHYTLASGRVVHHGTRRLLPGARPVVLGGQPTLGECEER